MPPPILNAQNNGNYGGNLINQKYSPLQQINLNGGVRADYEGLFTNRSNVLRGINAYPPNMLTFYGNMPAVAAADPMVVVSSGRAEWVSWILQNAENHPAFNGYLDNTTFQLNGNLVPVAWYSPRRSGRQLYIVVHWSEYDYYEARVGNNQIPDVTVVGYEFTATRPALDIVGFGASRYAALQLMIQQGYHRAWAVDDNVINVNGFPNTLAAVEALMPLPGAFWGLGFGAATSNVNAIQGRVNFQNNNPVILGTHPGLLQQVVLWNLDLLGPAHLNYSPMFVTSNEDVSLSNYLQHTNRDERIFTVCSIVKYEPFGDPGLGQPDPNLGASVEIPKRRNRMLALFSSIEADIPINPGGIPQGTPLQGYVRDTVLPQAGQPANTLPTAQSRAIEQVLSAAVTQGWYPGAGDLPFNPYAGALNGVPVTQVLAPAQLPIAVTAVPRSHRSGLSIAR